MPRLAIYLWSLGVVWLTDWLTDYTLWSSYETAVIKDYSGDYIIILGLLRSRSLWASFCLSFSQVNLTRHPFVCRVNFMWRYWTNYHIADLNNALQHATSLQSWAYIDRSDLRGGNEYTSPNGLLLCIRKWQNMFYATRQSVREVSPNKTSQSVGKRHTAVHSILQTRELVGCKKSQQLFNYHRLLNYIISF